MFGETPIFHSCLEFQGDPHLLLLNNFQLVLRMFEGLNSIELWSLKSTELYLPRMMSLWPLHANKEQLTRAAQGTSQVSARPAGNFDVWNFMKCWSKCLVWTTLGLSAAALIISTLQQVWPASSPISARRLHVLRLLPDILHCRVEGAKAHPRTRS